MRPAMAVDKGASLPLRTANGSRWEAARPESGRAADHEASNDC